MSDEFVRLWGKEGTVRVISDQIVPWIAPDAQGFPVVKTTYTAVCVEAPQEDHS